MSVEAQHRGHQGPQGAGQVCTWKTLAAPDTVDTMPEKTLIAFAESGALKGAMAKDGGDAEQVLARFAAAGVNVDALATQLQVDGASSFVKSWAELMQRIKDKSAALATT